MHQNDIKELFGKVLVQGRVLVNMCASGEFTFAGLVRHYSPFSIISISSGHPPFVHFGWGGLPISASDGEGSHVRLGWGGLPIWALDGEYSISDSQIGMAPDLSFRWEELPIRALVGECSLTGLEMGRAPYPFIEWRGLPVWAADGEGSPYPPQMDRSCDGERSLSHGSSYGPLPSFALTFYLFCLQSRGLKVVECVQSDDNAKDATSLAEAMQQFLGRGPCSSRAPNPNNRLPPKSPRPPVPPNDGVEPMQECNPNPGTGSQEGSDSEDPEGSSDEKEFSEHAEYDGQVLEDNVVDEDPLEEGEVEKTPSAAGSGPPEDDLDFAPADDTLGDPEVEELVQKKPKKAKKNKDVPNEEVDISEAPTKKQNIGGKRKGKKVATMSCRVNFLFFELSCEILCERNYSL
jgi:hypothetical protein